MNEEDAIVEDDDQSFAAPIENKNPAVVSDAFSAVGAFLGAYGWLCVAAVIILWYLKGILEQKLEAWQRQRANAEAHKTDSDAGTHHEELLTARAKLQEKYDAIAAQYAEKQKARDDEQRKQKVEDYEAHLKGSSSHASKERTQAMGTIGGLMGNSGGGGGGSGGWRPAPRRQGPS